MGQEVCLIDRNVMEQDLASAAVVEDIRQQQAEENFWTQEKDENMTRNITLCLTVFGATALSGPGPSHSRGF